MPHATVILKFGDMYHYYTYSQDKFTHQNNVAVSRTVKNQTLSDVNKLKCNINDLKNLHPKN